MSNTPGIFVSVTCKRFPGRPLSRGDRFHGLIAMGVVLVVILPIVAIAYVLQPCSIFAVPPDGLLNSLLQIHTGRPAQFSADFATFEGVTAVVPGAVRHSGHQAFRFA